MKDMLDLGLIYPFNNQTDYPSGIAIDRDQHPISHEGIALKTIWRLGNPAEGANFILMFWYGRM